MKPRLAALLLVSALHLTGSPARAQNLILQDGRTISVTHMRRAGENLLVPMQLGSSTGDVGYPMKTIVRAEFPEPAQMAAARAALAQGKPDDAIAALAPAIEFFQPISEVPGGWWARVALLKAEALDQAGREAEAATLLEAIARTAPDQADTQTARLRLTKALIAKGRFSEAQAACAEALQHYPNDSSIAAEAWLRSGDILLAQRQYEQALMAYLHVPALYSRESQAMPPALLGSARAYIALKDLTHGEDALVEITKNFPVTAEARLAAAELQALKKSEAQ